MLSSVRFIFSIALHYNHLENVWSGLAANSELYFARLQNDSPTVQDCHWYMSMFCPVSPWTQCHIQLKTGGGKLWVCLFFKKRSAALMTVCRTKRLFTDCRHSAWDLRHAPLTVKWLKTALYCNYNKNTVNIHLWLKNVCDFLYIIHTTSRGDAHGSELWTSWTSLSVWLFLQFWT